MKNNIFFKRLDEFRATHEQKRLVNNCVEWSYYSSGNGKETMLLLVGGTGVGEAAFLNIMELEKDCRVIVPSFPTVYTISELVDGIIRILDEEGVEKFNILGQSLGGILAQELIARCGERVKKVILSHTTTITPALDKAMLDKQRKAIKKLIKLIRILPLRLIKPLLKKKMRRLMIMQNEQEREFWKYYFDELLDSKTKREEIASYSSMADFAENYMYTEEAFKDWNGKVLILDSDSDKAFDKTQKDALKSLFPQAEAYTFKGTGHLSIIVAREEYMKRVKDFLYN